MFHCLTIPSLRHLRQGSIKVSHFCHRSERETSGGLKDRRGQTDRRRPGVWSATVHTHRWVLRLTFIARLAPAPVVWRPRRRGSFHLVQPPIPRCRGGSRPPAHRLRMGAIREQSALRLPSVSPLEPSIVAARFERNNVFGRSISRSEVGLLGGGNLPPIACSCSSRSSWDGASKAPPRISGL